MAKWTLEINRKLESLESSTRIVAWYGHTGNFVVESCSVDSSEIASELMPVVGTACAALPHIAAVEGVSVAQKAASPQPLAGKRWTCGIVFAVEAPPFRAVPEQTLRAVFFPITDHAIGAWKLETLTETGILDQERSVRGWSAISADVSTSSGGVWTARSLRTVNAILEKGSRYTWRS